MIGGVLSRLNEIEAALAVPVGEIDVVRVRKLVSGLAREFAEKLGTDGGTITVEESHEAHAIEAVTAYLDGAERGDGFELLAETVVRMVDDGDGGVEWMLGVTAALARLAGDLSVLAAARDGRSDWSGALEIIQQFAKPTEN